MYHRYHQPVDDVYICRLCLCTVWVFNIIPRGHVKLDNTINDFVFYSVISCVGFGYFFQLCYFLLNLAAVFLLDLTVDFSLILSCCLCCLLTANNTWLDKYHPSKFWPVIVHLAVPTNTFNIFSWSGSCLVGIWSWWIWFLICWSCTPFTSFVKINSATSIGFGLVWFGLVVYWFAFVPLVQILFPWLGV